jgi:hypothetical protein
VIFHQDAFPLQKDIDFVRRSYESKGDVKPRNDISTQVSCFQDTLDDPHKEMSNWNNIQEHRSVDKAI